MAHLNGWKVAHFRKARVGKRWMTPVAADGKGFHDLMCVHPVRGRILAIECKTNVGVMKPEQREWKAWMERAGIMVLIARPRNFQDIRKELER